MQSIDMYILVQQEQHKDRLQEAERYRLAMAATQMRGHKQRVVQPALIGTAERQIGRKIRELFRPAAWRRTFAWRRG